MTALHDLMIRTPGLPCRLDPDPFFSDNSRDRDAAARLCRTCPLREACANHALTEREEYGVWGGTTVADRRSFWTGRPWRFDEEGRLRLECGSEDAYRSHFAYREAPCEECTGAHEAHVEAQRREKLARIHGAGGSGTGYYLHRRLGEQPCGPCKEALRIERACVAPGAQRGQRRPRAVLSAPGPAEGVHGAPVAVQPASRAA